MKSANTILDSTQFSTFSGKSKKKIRKSPRVSKFSKKGIQSINQTPLTKRHSGKGIKPKSQKQILNHHQFDFQREKGSIRDLEDNLSNQKTEILNKEHKIQMLEAKLQNSNQLIIDLQKNTGDELFRVKTELNEQKKKTESLESKNQLLESKLKESSTNYSDQLKAVEEDKASLQSDLRKYQTTIEDQIKTINHLKATLALKKDSTSSRQPDSIDSHKLPSFGQFVSLEEQNEDLEQAEEAKDDNFQYKLDSDSEDSVDNETYSPGRELRRELVGTDFTSVKPRMIDSEMGNPMKGYESVEQMMLEIEQLKSMNDDLQSELAVNQASNLLVNWQRGMKKLKKRSRNMARLLFRVIQFTRVLICRIILIYRIRG